MQSSQRIVITYAQRDQSFLVLASEIFSCAGCPIWKRDVNRLVGTVNHGLTEDCPDLMRRREKSDILSSKIRRETGYEHGRAHNFGVARCMMR
jgi:hypothetical protein